MSLTNRVALNLSGKLAVFVYFSLLDPEIPYKASHIYHVIT